MSMKKKGQYKKFVYQMSCLSITGGVASMVGKKIPEVKIHTDKIQTQLNQTTPLWKHIGTNSKLMRLVKKKIDTWTDKHINTEKQIYLTDLLAFVIGLLVDLLPQLDTPKKREKVDGILKSMEFILDEVAKIEEEDLEFDEKSYEMLKGWGNGL